MATNATSCRIAQKKIEADRPFDEQKISKSLPIAKSRKTSENAKADLCGRRVDDLSHLPPKKRFTKAASEIESGRIEESAENLLFKKRKFSKLGGANRYSKLGVIGVGSFSKVYEAIDKSNMQLVAIKTSLVGIECFESLQKEKSIYEELSSLKRTPGVLPLIDSYTSSEPNSKGVNYTAYNLVMEKCVSDLHTARIHRSQSRMTIAETINVAAHLLRTEFYFSNSLPHLIHADLKPQNILVSREGNLFVSDFGLAKRGSPVLREPDYVQTLWYRSPEVLFAQPFGVKADMWSIGCILYEMYMGTPLFPAREQEDSLDEVKELTKCYVAHLGAIPAKSIPNKLLEILSKSSPELFKSNNSFEKLPMFGYNHQGMSDNALRLQEQLKSLIVSMLAYDPDERICVSQALKTLDAIKSGIEV